MRARFQLDEEPQAWARSVHRTKRLWFLAVFGNALLFGLMLGVPYARGLLRAQQIRRGYARAAACLLGGTAAKEPGLGALNGAAERLAARLVTADAHWVKRCDRALAELAPTEATFVWPPAKQGEARVREAVQILRHELSTLAKLQLGHRLPSRPSRALGQLSDMLEQHATLTGALDIPPQAAVTFAAAAELPSPARLPLYASADAVLTLWGNDSELFAVGLDRTGLSYLHADANRLQRARHVRPKLLQSFLRFGDTGYLGYAVSAKKCQQRVDGCARKSMGLSPVTLPLTELPPPRWLASHPAGRLDQSVRSRAAHWLVAAQADGGESELRTLVPPVYAADTTLPSPAYAPTALSATDQVVFVDAALVPLVWGVSRTAEHSVLFELSSSEQPPNLPQALRRVVATLGNHDSQVASSWAVSCSSAGSHGFVLGNQRQLVVGNVQGASRRVWKPVALSVASAFHEHDPVQDSVVRLCGSATAVAFVRDAQQDLWLVRCDPSSDVCALSLVAAGAAGFAVLQAKQSIVVAYSGAGERAQILVQRFDLAAKALGKAQLPSPCWEPRGGMCGQPHLAQLGERVVLTAHEGTDLLVLESPDEGQHWKALAHDGQAHL